MNGFIIALIVVILVTLGLAAAGLGMAVKAWNRKPTLRDTLNVGSPWRRHLVASVADDDYHVPGGSTFFWPGTFVDSVTKSAAGVSVVSLPSDLAGGPPAGSRGLSVTLPKTASDYLITVVVENKITGDGSETDAGLTLHTWMDKTSIGVSTESVTDATLRQWTFQVAYSSTVRASASSTLYFALQNQVPSPPAAGSSANTLNLNGYATYVDITEIVGEATIA